MANHPQTKQLHVTRNHSTDPIDPNAGRSIPVLATQQELGLFSERIVGLGNNDPGHLADAGKNLTGSGPDLKP
jgi:hypothetical protein